jgi:putative ABC transport system permease protein
VLQFIKDETMKLNPKLTAFNVEPILFEQQLENAFYRKEYDQFVVISLFSLLSIVIALLGVFGLVFFETEYRRSEIAIRRVNGALVSDILMLFSGRFVKMLVVCFAIAVPIATYFMTTWLQEFAYKAPLHLWVYVVAFLAVALLVVAVVVTSSWRVVTQNPVEVINRVQ